jgi:hypothetical protein
MRTFCFSSVSSLLLRPQKAKCLRKDLGWLRTVARLWLASSLSATPKTNRINGPTSDHCIETNTIENTPLVSSNLAASSFNCICVDFDHSRFIARSVVEADSRQYLHPAHHRKKYSGFFPAHSMDFTFTFSSFCWASRSSFLQFVKHHAYDIVQYTSHSQFITWSTSVS